MFKNEQTNSALRELYNLDLKKIEHTEFSEIFDFSNILNRTQEIVEDLKKIDNDKGNLKITETTENAIKKIVVNLKSHVIDKSINFIVKDNSHASNQYTEILNTLNRIHDEFINLSLPLINTLEIKSIKPEEITSTLNNLKSAKDDSDRLCLELKEKIKEVQDVITKLRTSSGVQAAQISATNFKAQADEHEKMAKRWLGGSVFLIFFLICIIFSLLNGLWPFRGLQLENSINTYNAIQIIVFKLIILSTNYFAIHQSIKNYRVHRHLYILNKHRNNALTVYPQMLVAGEGADVRTVITAEAAKSIFEPATSGYLNGDDDPRPVNPTAIINKIIDKNV